MPRSRSRGIGVEDAFLCELGIAEIAALLEKGVDHGGLAVVNVSNDRHVANVVSNLIHFISPMINQTSAGKQK